MPVINEEDCCAFLKGEIVEDDLQQLARDELRVLAAYLGMHGASTAHKHLLLEYVRKEVLGMSGVQEERGEEMAQRSPFSPVFGPHPVSNTVPDSIQQQQPQTEQYTLPPSVIDNPEGGFLPIQTELERLKLESERIDLPVADHLRTHRKWGSLEEAADEADGYVLTHEFVGRRTPFQNKFKDNLKHRSDNSDIKSNPVLLKNQEGPGESQRGRSGNFGRGPCTYCNKPGHTESACWTKARDLRRQTSSVNAVASFRDTSPETESPETESESVACVAPRVGVKNALVTDVTGRVDSTVRDFGPFLSVGTVKVGGEEETLTAPKLRETAASVPHAEDDVDLHLTELFTPPTQETSSPPPPHCPAGLKDLQQADDDCKRLADVALSEDECEREGGGVTRDVLKQSFRSESWGLIWIGNGTSRCLASVSLSSRLPGRLDFLPASVLHSGPSWTVLFSIIIILLPSWARQTVFLS
ncbi:hypothetical protein Pcinc_042869 [Petrolisthes cinctipes]|uniref:CCHC-type domain-containing protein n=1 Tax=Petrolisthes cinctipes TaxID=88211 RepID=A0AAE1BGT5_PETCI|nr:hypothetical protein Pcinc_042869 [Petrolisthes cinctipes]